MVPNVTNSPHSPFYRVGGENHLTLIVSTESCFINSNKLTPLMSEQTKGDQYE
jgi:hypothetical protein